MVDDGISSDRWVVDLGVKEESSCKAEQDHAYRHCQLYARARDCRSLHAHYNKQLGRQ